MIAGEVQPGPVQGDSGHLVVECAAVHDGLHGNESSSPRGRPGRDGSQRDGQRHVLHARRGRHHHVHLHAGRPVPRAADAAHLPVQRLQLHQHVLHVQEHARLHATHVSTGRHSGLALFHTVHTLLIVFYQIVVRSRLWYDVLSVCRPSIVCL